MAVDLRRGRSQRAQPSAGEVALLADVDRLQTFLQGHCFTALNFLQRAATFAGIKLALLGASGASHVELHDDGWIIRDKPQPPAPSSFEKLIDSSFARDYDSQRARMMVRRQTREADDVYFSACDGDGDGDGFDALLERFREQTAFQLGEA